MLQEERYNQIYSVLNERNIATVQFLSKKLFVSEATIRRDLDMMEKAGLIKRVWGGAMIPSTVDKDIPSFVRSKTNNDLKAKIAAAAVPFIKENSSIFIDSSTTCYHLIPYISNLKHVTVITSSVFMMQKLLDNTSATVHLLGGQVFENHILTGHIAVSNVMAYHTDLMFFSCSGIGNDGVLYSVESRFVEVSRVMMKNTEQRILLCDSSKFGKTAFWRLADLCEIDTVICDKAPENEDLLQKTQGRLVSGHEL